MVERQDLINQAGAGYRFKAIDLRGRASEVPGKDPISAIRRRVLASRADSSEQKAEHEEAEAKSVLERLDRYVWSNDVHDTLQRCTRHAEIFGDTNLVSDLVAKQNRNAEDVYEQIYELDGIVHPSLATLIDRTLLTAEGILLTSSVDLFTSILMITTDYQRERDVPRIGANTIKAGGINILNATKLAYLFLGLNGQLGRIPEISDEGLFDGKKKAMRHFVPKFGDKKAVVSFIFRSPELRELKKYGQPFGALISSMSVSASIHASGFK